MPEEKILLTQSRVPHPLLPLYLYMNRANFSSGLSTNNLLKSLLKIYFQATSKTDFMYG